MLELIVGHRIDVVCNPIKRSLYMSTNTDDTVDAAPFVDDTDDKDVKNTVEDEDSGNETDDSENQPVDPDSKDGVEAENEAQSSDDDGQQDIDGFLSKIEDKVIDRLIERMADDSSKTSALDSDDANTERKNAMTYGVRKRAEDENKPDETLTPEEVLNQAPDQGIAFEQVKNDDLTESEVPGSANVGDNLDGSQKNPGDIDDTNETVDKPHEKTTASTASVLHLVDQFIKAGVYDEDERWAKVEELSNSSAVKVRTASAIIDLMHKAQKDQSDKFARLAMQKSAAKCADDGTKTDDDEMDAVPSPVDPDTDTDKDDDKKEDTKTSAIIDQYGTVRGIVAGHKGRYSWKLVDSTNRSAGRRSGVTDSMFSAIRHASTSFGKPLSEATTVNIISASKRRAQRVAKVQSSVNRSVSKRTERHAMPKRRIARPETPKLARPSAHVDDVTTALL